MYHVAAFVINSLSCTISLDFFFSLHFLYRLLLFLFTVLPLSNQYLPSESHCIGGEQKYSLNTCVKIQLKVVIIWAAANISGKGKQIQIRPFHLHSTHLGFPLIFVCFFLRFRDILNFKTTIINLIKSQQQTVAFVVVCVDILFNRAICRCWDFFYCLRVNVNCLDSIWTFCHTYHWNKVKIQIYVSWMAWWWKQLIFKAWEFQTTTKFNINSDLFSTNSKWCVCFCFSQTLNICAFYFVSEKCRILMDNVKKSDMTLLHRIRFCRLCLDFCIISSSLSYNWMLRWMQCCEPMKDSTAASKNACCKVFNKIEFHVGLINTHSLYAALGKCLQSLCPIL